MQKHNMVKRMIATSAAATMALGSVTVSVGAEEVKWTQSETADGWMKIINEDGATLGYSTESGVALLEVDGYAFKDLDRDGELDVFEDWRESADARATDLAAKLTMEECGALMMYPAVFSIEDDGSDAPADSGGNFSEAIKQGMRSVLSFAATYDYATQATWNNSAQLQAETEMYGIPVNIAANPRDFGMWTGDNLALSATFDADLVNEVAQILGEQYRAIGVGTLLGPQIDLSTEPRWNRIGGTFGEDPKLSTDMANAMISGLQSTYDEEGNDLGWGEDSVIAMMKHYPGDGAGEGGREGHIGSPGEYTVYPGDGFETALIPFVDAGLSLESITEECAAVMTSYSIAYSEDEEYGELVGTSFSEYKINLLRENYGYDGVICTDWIFGGVTIDEGVSELTDAEKIAKCITAGVDQLGGLCSYDSMTEGLKELSAQMGEEAALARVQESARRIIKSFFKAGLFENAYVDTAEANETVNSEEALMLADEVGEKSIVLLKNENGAVAEANESEEKLTVYIPLVYSEASSMVTGIGQEQAIPASWDFPIDRKLADQYFNVVTDAVGEPTGEPDAEGNATYTEDDVVRASAEELAECDMALVIVQNPQSGAGYDSDTETYYPISLQYREYKADSESVRSESIAGKTIKTEVANPYGVETQVSQENRSYYGETSQITNEGDLDLILYVAEIMPEDANVVVGINTDSPLVVSEFEESVDAIVLNFGVGDEYTLRVVSGKVEPTGLLPFQMPASMEAVEAQYEDVPRDMECYVDTAGNTYDFAYGLNWSGVISDERTETYGVDPVLELQNDKVE